LPHKEYCLVVLLHARSSTVSLPSARTSRRIQYYNCIICWFLNSFFSISALFTKNTTTTVTIRKYDALLWRGRLSSFHRVGTRSYDSILLDRILMYFAPFIPQFFWIYCHNSKPLSLLLMRHDCQIRRADTFCYCKLKTFQKLC
jgi:hypothetical protein